MITARSSVVKVPVGYYPDLSLILKSLVNPGRSPKIPCKKKPLNMTPQAVRARYLRKLRQSQEKHRG